MWHGPRSRRCPWTLALMLVAGSPTAVSQGSRTDYERANLLARRTEDRVFRQRVRPHWMPDGRSFWYRVSTGPDAAEHVFVDAEAGVRQPLVDAAALARALGSALGTPVNADRLPLRNVTVEPPAGGAPGPGTVRFHAGGRQWEWNPAGSQLREVAAETPGAPSPDRTPTRSRPSGEETRLQLRNESGEDLDLFWLDTDGVRRGYGRLRAGQERSQHTFVGHVFLLTDREGTPVAVVEAEEEGTPAIIGPREGRSALHEPESPSPRAPERPAGTSPDGQWIVELHGHNLHLRRTGESAAVALSTDGSAEAPYRGEIHWSPDSAWVVGTRVRPGDDRRVSFVEAAPRDRVEPQLHSHRYLKPGDRLPEPRLRMFRVADRRAYEVASSQYEHPFTEDGDLGVQWSPDSREFRFDYNQRGHQRYRILAVPVPDAATDGHSTLTPRVVVDESSDTFIDWTQKTWRHWLEDRGELLWMSERDGWAHLWLYNARTGAVIRQVTRGEWVVREVLHVDADRQEVWFLAGGVREGEDPYHQHLCRVGLDGTGFVRLTEGDGTHRIEFSPDRRWFLDTWSRADHPPVTELRRSGDGSRVMTLESADISALLAAGWTLPERFVAPGRDGRTPIHGVVIRPSHFDPTLKYPVIEEVYAGPQGAFAPKEFGRLLRQHALAELGFVVVQADGMGTNHRGKRFHETAWKNLADAGFPDRIAWIRAAAATRPWMDLTRVGIYGGSAGGQNAARALLDHGDFYQVAVADCGCHDNRMDKIWWNEQWLGWPLDDSYRRSSNVEDAARLQGKLLLIVGEMDTNVDPASTLQLAAALVRADKDFDLLVLPGANHGAAESPYGSRRRMDFFVRHLLRREPRWE